MQRRTIARAASAIAALALLAAAAGPANADAKKWMAQLKAGKVIAMSVPSGSIFPGRAMAIIPAPAHTVYSVLAAFETYHQFVPRITAARRLDASHYELRATFPWPVSKTITKLAVRKGKRGSTYIITWRMVGGTRLKKYEGTAWIQPWGKGRALLTYQMLAVPKIFAPNGIMSVGLRNAVKGFVKAARKRVDDVAAGKVAPGKRVANR